MKTLFTRSISLITACFFGGLYSVAAIAGTTVYIPMGSGNGVAEVDAETDTVTRHFTGVENPHGSVVTPDGKYVLTGSLAEGSAKTGDATNSNLYLVHPAHGHVMQTIPVTGWSHHQAITPDGRYVLSTHPTRNHVSVVDVQSGTQIKLIQTENTPYFVLVTADGSKAYVSNSGAGTVQEIDTATWQIIRSFAAGPSPEHMVLSADESELYVNNSRKGALSVIPLALPEQRKEIPVAASLHGLDISDDGRHLFISSTAEEKLVVYTPETGETLSVSLSPKPYHLNTVTGAGKVYVSSRSEPRIWVIDQISFEVINSFELPAGEGHQMSIVQ